MTTRHISISHPEVLEADETTMASDREWFAAHPHEVVRIRPVIDGEFLPDAAASIAGQRQWICAPGATPGEFPHVAVVDSAPALGIVREADGRGPRVRLPLTAHKPEDVADIKATALGWVERQVQLLRAQHAKEQRQRRARPRGFR
jgi:hypothetical protein